MRELPGRDEGDRAADDAGISKDPVMAGSQKRARDRRSQRRTEAIEGEEPGARSGTSQPMEPLGGNARSKPAWQNHQLARGT